MITLQEIWLSPGDHLVVVTFLREQDERRERISFNYIAPTERFLLDLIFCLAVFTNKKTCSSPKNLPLRTGKSVSNGVYKLYKHRINTFRIHLKSQQPEKLLQKWMFSGSVYMRP